MKKEIYYKNYKILKEYNEHIFKKQDEEQIKEDANVCIYETAAGSKGLYIDLAERGIIQLGSQYAPNAYAKIWFDYQQSINPIKEDSIIICFGLGSGEYIRQITKNRKEDNLIFIYEPSVSVRNSVLYNIDLSGSIDDKTIIFTNTDEDNQLFKAHMATILSYSNISRVIYYDLPNYRRAFKKEYDDYKYMIINAIKSEWLNINTDRRFSEVKYKNDLASLEAAADSYSLNDLYDKLPQGKPAFIISAGPSLEKNIEDLKAVKDHGFIVATDTALKPLLAHGIIPDLYATIDAAKYSELFENDIIKSLPLIGTFYAKKEIIESNQNIVFFDYENTAFQKIMNKLEPHKKHGILAQGGSVANFIFSFLVRAKMNPIVFVGQDLAYTNNKKHVEGAFSDSQDVLQKDVDRNAYVEDNDGNLILTDPAFIIYKEWFEDYIYFYRKSFRFINATEGGAKINGTEVMTLKEVIEKECKEEIDFEEIVKSASLLFDDNKRVEYYDELLKINDSIDEFKDVCSELKECYEDIERLSKNDVITKQELVDKLKIVRKNTKYLDEEYMLLPLIESYEAAATARSNLNSQISYDDVNDDLRDIANRGLVKVKSLLEGLDKIMPDIMEFVENIENRKEKLLEYIKRG